MSQPKRGSEDEVRVAYSKIKRLIEKKNKQATQAQVDEMSDKEFYERLCWAYLDWYTCLSQTKDSKDAHLGIRTYMEQLKGLIFDHLEDVDQDTVKEFFKTFQKKRENPAPDSESE